MAKLNAWADAPEPTEIAQMLIKRDFPELDGHRVECVFCLEPQKRLNQVAWAYIYVLRGINAYNARRNDPDFLEKATDCGPDEWVPPDESFQIVVWKRLWDELKPEQREALIFHELRHAAVEYGNDGFPKLALVGHDLEEFDDVVRRYGAWREQVSSFAESLDAGKEINAHLRRDWGSNW